jgi:hypothetical protein
VRLEARNDADACLVVLRDQFLPRYYARPILRRRYWELMKLAELDSKSRQNSPAPITTRPRTNWQRSTKRLPGKPRTRKKSRWPSPCSARDEGRIFEAGHYRSSTNRCLLHPVRCSHSRGKNRGPNPRGPSRIAGWPFSGRSVAQRPGVRVVLLLDYRYKIFYRVTGDAIRILHIRQSSRRPYDYN